MPGPADTPRAPRASYITTPIYYVNDKPHIGHAYTTTLCDIWARAMRLRGDDVFFLTGTDEHGQKVEKSAAEHGKTPQQWADENAAEFQRVLKVFGLTNDDFIRTTQPRHEKQVQALVKRLLDSGDVYLGTFEGWYDEGQEEYYTETRAKELEYKSPVSGKPLVRAKEQNYYFKLSAYQQKLEEFFAANAGFVQPEGRFNEVRGRLRDGLQDVPITRTNFTWGIPFPNDPANSTSGEHVIYVWIDALFNYVTALGLGDESGTFFESSTSKRTMLEARGGYWPANYHVIGKEILWFHAVIWPALLMALKLPQPRRIHAHSFWISDGQKMSKSLGNFVDLPTIERYFERYGLDAWRWYMATQGPLQASDADFRASHFHEIYTADLVNVVGNCPSRVTAMIGKYFEGKMPADAAAGGAWKARCASAVAAWRAAMDSFNLAAAAEEPVKLLRELDIHINDTQPFKLAKDPTRAAELASILAQCTEVVRIAGVLLTPFMPWKMAELAHALGQRTPPTTLDERAETHATFDELTRWGAIAPGTPIAKVALFPRVDLAAKA